VKGPDGRPGVQGAGDGPGLDRRVGRHDGLVVVDHGARVEGLERLCGPVVAEGAVEGDRVPSTKKVRVGRRRRAQETTSRSLVATPTLTSASS